MGKQLTQLIVAICSMAGGSGLVICGIIFPNAVTTIDGGKTEKAFTLISFGVYFFLAGLFGFYIRAKQSTFGMLISLMIVSIPGAAFIGYGSWILSQLSADQEPVGLDSAFYTVDNTIPGNEYLNQITETTLVEITNINLQESLYPTGLDSGDEITNGYWQLSTAKWPTWYMYVASYQYMGGYYYDPGPQGWFKFQRQNDGSYLITWKYYPDSYLYMSTSGPIDTWSDHPGPQGEWLIERIDYQSETFYLLKPKEWPDYCAYIHDDSKQGTANSWWCETVGKQGYWILTKVDEKLISFSFMLVAMAIATLV